jgi:hypothetical protein
MVTGGGTRGAPGAPLDLRSRRLRGTVRGPLTRIASITVVTLVRHFARRWRHPRLLLVSAALLVADLAIPDALPFVDEILLALVTLALARPVTTSRPPEERPDGRQ